MKAKAVFSLVGVLVLVLSVFLARPAMQVSADDPAILKFSTMIGVPKAYTAGQNPIRGINGGGLPWIIGSAEGKLTTGGKLNISITGLVFDPSDPVVVQRGLANRNTVPAFRAIVSCQTVDGGVENVVSDPFPATTGLASEGGGNAEIQTKISLPQPCIAPLIFVTSPGQAWFATTGY